MRTKIVILSVLILVIAGAVIFATRTNKTQTQSPLRIGVITWIGNGIFYVAQDNQFWQNEGIGVEIVPVEDFAVAKQLMGSRRIDGYIATTDTVQLLRNEGIDVTVTFVTDISSGGDGIIAIQDIKSLQDLKGKKVAFESATPSHFLLAHLLDQNGLTPNDLTIINQTAPDAGASFVAGKVDAAVTWEPWISKAGEREGGHVLLSTKTLPPIIADLPLFRADIVKQRPDDIKAFMRGVFEAMEFAEKNEVETIAIIARAFNLTPQEVKEQLPTMRWTDYEYNMKYLAPGPESLPTFIDKAGELWLKLGLIKKKTPAEEVIDA